MPIPAGVIAIWTGTLVNIPAGWNLCDGGGGRPNLLEKFLKGVSDAATNPGTTGGSDTHLHVESATGGAHNHGGTSGSGGAHTHTTPTSTGSHGTSEHGIVAIEAGGDDSSYGNLSAAGSHNHTWPSEGAHTHPIDSQGAHAHTFQNADTRPAYYQVAFIYSDGTPATFAQNIIALWSGTLANIPTGFSLDTTLVAKFLRGVPAATDPGGTGGADTHTHTQDAAGAHTHALSSTAHTHTSNSEGSHNHGISAVYNTTLGTTVGINSLGGTHTHASSSAGAHTHTAASAGSHLHTINTTDGRPPYYELAPIKAGAGGASLAIGVIATWTGLLANIPANWAICDGNGGRPNLFSKFIRGVATAGTNPGGTGGNLTHTHTPNAAGDHTHTVDSQGTHTHTCNNSTWSHNHGALSKSKAGAYALGTTLYGPAHNHGSLSSTGAHTDHSTTASGTHVDHTYGTASSLPAYYEVAYIYCTLVVTAKPASSIVPLMMTLLEEGVLSA